jgi:hypothetical protein
MKSEFVINQITWCIASMVLLYAAVQYISTNESLTDGHPFSYTLLVSLLTPYSLYVAAYTQLLLILLLFI